MRISLCDDDPAVLSQLEHLIASYFGERNIVYSVESHVDPLSFLTSAKSDLPDLVFLDLMPGQIEGFDVARELRKLSIETEIVFVTSCVNRMSEAFAYKPVAFLEKPIRAEDVNAVLKTIMVYHWHKGLAYVVQTKRGRQRILHKTIEYFESRQHQIIIHLATGDASISFAGKLDDVEAALKGMSYVRCHKSYLVQILAVRALDRSGPAFMTNAGKCVPISRTYYQRAIRAFVERTLQ